MPQNLTELWEITMKYILTLALIITSFGAQAYYEDHPVVQELAESGVPALTKKAEDCPSSYGDQSFVDRLGPSKTYGSLCVKHKRLPGEVLSEIIEMKENELQNESDYDQRVTAFWVFEQTSFKPGWMNSRQVKEIAKVLGIPAKQAKEPSFGSYIADEDSFGQFEGLYIGEEYSSESATLSHLRSLLKGKTVLELSMGDGVELYPGGGFYVTHYIFIVEGKLIYVKLSGWDA